jgi:MYXO-CTERM domain-containing protein
MSSRSSRTAIVTGILCFVATLVIGVALSRERAAATDEKEGPAAVQTLTRGMRTPISFEGETRSPILLPENELLVHRTSVFISLDAADPRGLKVFLSSPSGTRVLVADGSKKVGVSRTGLDGWFGGGGYETVESLDAFTGEPVSGRWTLTVASTSRAQLRSWGLSTEAGPNASLAGIETYGEYNGNGSGCNCRVAEGEGASRFPGVLLALGVVAFALARRGRGRQG